MTTTNTPLSPVSETYKDKEIARLTAENDSLKSENAELHARLDKAVELKAKMGEKIYFPWIWDGMSGVGRLTIIDIRIDSEGKPIYRTDFYYDDEIKGYWKKYKCGEYQDSDFGEIVFTEKDYNKAEARLAELKGGGRE